MSAMNNQGRPTGAGEASSSSSIQTYTGNRGLRLEEPLIFELDNPAISCACRVKIIQSTQASIRSALAP